MAIDFVLSSIGCSNGARDSSVSFYPLDRDGYVLRKSQVRSPTLDDQGGYMIFDARTNLPIHGHNWNLDLDDVETYAQLTFRRNAALPFGGPLAAGEVQASVKSCRIMRWGWLL